MKTIHKNGHAPRHDHREILDEAKGRFATFAKEARNVEDRILDGAKRKGAELLEDAQVKGQAAWKRTAKWIQKNPGTSVGIAVVAGVLLRSLFTKSEE
jgi:ElaB/YqjD/DUF883 family membrane-anchored ribosome-binding protein